MKVRLLCFAALRDRFGGASELECPEGETLGSLARRLGLDPSVSFGLNQELAPAGAALSDGDEVALLPPVSGG